MTETDKPYLVEHDQKMTTMNVNLLSLTESDWIWPKEFFLLILPQRWKYMIEVDQKKKNIINITTTTIDVDQIYCNLNFRSYSHNHFHRCGKYILYSQFSVIFTRSFWSLWEIYIVFSIFGHIQTIIFIVVEIFRSSSQSQFSS